jgi:hypothetical protein
MSADSVRYTQSMALALCSDLSPADWIVASEVPWAQLVCFGPAAFGAYARLRFVPDPTFAGQQEFEADVDAVPSAPDQWRALFELLAAHTETPEDCYFCLWEGWPFADAVGRLPKLSVPVGARLPARSYFLFRGALSDAGDWGAAQYSSGAPSPYEPAFVWPADRAWCVANDVDPHWAGIGADASVIEQLVADPHLDAVGANAAEDQPAYR